MNIRILVFISLISLDSSHVAVASSDQRASADQIAAQSAALETNTKDSGYGPQSPRDLSLKKGVNGRIFSTAPVAAKMNLCNGYYQALNIPQNAGIPIQYSGSTTGPTYNEKGSPLQVSWSVRPKVLKVNAASFGEWCKDNMFKEDHAHGVRNLVTNESLLSEIK